MFRALGWIVARGWFWLLLAWVLVFVGATYFAPEWSSVAKEGEFGFLPDRMPSRIGDKLFDQAFPDEVLASSVVLIVRRHAVPDELTDGDRQFVNETLVARLREMAGLGAMSGSGTEPERVTAKASLISRVRSSSDDLTGPLLATADNRALLVIVELQTDFVDLRNGKVVREIERLLEDVKRDSSCPPGLEIHVSGSATVGRDLSSARTSSADATRLMTVVLVVVLLVLIYRAPLPALIPLLTVFVSVELSLKLLSILAMYSVVGLFDGVQTYITVIVYGAGVDYCLFLTARYREEIDAGATFDEAIASALSSVGAALTASAGTVIGGIGMMVFAEFGKFQEAGVAISFSLCIVLLAALTLSSSVLRLAGRWAFWPIGIAASVATSDEPRSRWDRVGELLLKRPGSVLGVSFAVMLPLCVVAVMFSNLLSYGLISNLPLEAPSVRGTRELQSHFPAGISGPLTMLIRSDELDFTDPDGADTVSQITQWLEEHKSDLRLADVRSLSHPLGITEAGSRGLQGLSPARVIARRAVLRQKAAQRYVSHAGSLQGHVTRLELVFEHDPFARESIAQLDHIEPILRTEAAKLLPKDSAVHFIGSTASIRDVKVVRTGDQVRISLLVCLSVFVILVLLLRKPLVSLYLVASVLVSYVTTYGATLTVFWALDPTGFNGLDWKLPMLLFTILVAVGEDYNIFLMSRVEEEQKRHGDVQGVVVALARTGRIISSCGVIMAGTFSALMFGSLVGMRQLGFALAFGVLLDTFLVRPILVPAFLILLYRRRSTETVVPAIKTSCSVPPTN